MIRTSLSLARHRTVGNKISLVRLLSSVHERFVPLTERELPEYNSVGRLYKHKGSGATVLSIQNDDEHKAFGAAFQTPVTDSTGVPHILEHSVLCGSRKYPSKEPFVELLKSSLQTFLNAFTYPDRTVYPVMSCNETDFYNLVDVYLDAVLHPRLTPLVLRQEGWHYTVSEKDGKVKLGYKGVVFNEMKGVYSSPDNLNHMELQHALFPSITYAHSSGGDPRAITELTFDQFKRFHENHYHPSNGLFYFYGDTPEDKRLEKLDEFLTEFSQQESNPPVSTQMPFQEPVAVTKPFPCEKGEEEHMVTVGWVLHDCQNPTKRLGLVLLDELLMGNETATLHKALMDSQLGSALTGGGLMGELVQPAFSAGLKGVNEDDIPAVKALIQETLEAIATSEEPSNTDGYVQAGFSSAHLEAALNTLEFRLREFASGGRPKGLALLLSAIPAWMYQRDLLSDLQFEETLSQLKDELKYNPTYLRELVKELLINNPHKAVVHMYPDPQMEQRTEQEEENDLNLKLASMSPEDIERVKREEQELKEHQERPDSPADVAKIPTLKVEDMGKEARFIPKDVRDLGNSKGTILAHTDNTAGIVYYSLRFDISHIPQRLQHLMPMFTRALFSLGTSNHSEVDMAHKIGSATGGVNISTANYTTDADRVLAKVVVSGKALSPKTQDMADILQELLLHANLRGKRNLISQMVAEGIAVKEATIASEGHVYTLTRIRSGQTASGALSEALEGVSQLYTLRALQQRIEEDWDGVVNDLETIRDLMLKGKVVASVMSEDGDSGSATRTLENLINGISGYSGPSLDSVTDTARSGFEYSKESLPLYPVGCDEASGTAILHRDLHSIDGHSPVFNAIVLPTQVNYVGTAVTLPPDMGSIKRPGSSDVVSNVLQMSYLWEHIRVRGGAYGAMATFNHRTRGLGLVTYRDPGLVGSLSGFQSAGKWLKDAFQSGLLSRDDINKSIISTIGTYDRPLTPAAKANVSTNRFILGVNDDEVQQRRDEVLSTSETDFNDFASALDLMAEVGDAGAVTSSKELDAARSDLESTYKLNVIRPLSEE